MIDPTSNGGPQRVRTRFAPSPTGFLHIGGVRTALYAWAYARHHGGDFILRIEDTDVERSTPEAVAAILEGMNWLGLTPDEGPFYQMQRMDRYREVVARMLAEGHAYHCYTTPQELDALREAQRARGEKPRYDGRWRPENAKGREPPPGVKPVVRFRNPDDGVVVWDDMVKGPIAIANAELDDLIIARSDGTPTYNFCVVVDDLEMRITHVIRGDDHVNNTPRQINLMRALGAEPPIYGHLPMIHGPDGQKLSKRHGAVSVLEYEEAGYLPEALINYLARLGWSHGDDEIFSREQLVSWFDGTHLSQSPAQLDFDKLRWVNQQYLRATDDAALAQAVLPRLERLLAGQGVAAPPDAAERLPAICRLWKDRAGTLQELAELAAILFLPPAAPSLEARTRHLTDAALDAMLRLAERLESTEWTPEAIGAALKAVLKEAGLKMPQLAVPVRLAVFGLEQTPSVDAMLAQVPRAVVLERLRGTGAGSGRDQ